MSLSGSSSSHWAPTLPVIAGLPAEALQNDLEYQSEHFLNMLKLFTYSSGKESVKSFWTGESFKKKLRKMMVRWDGILSIKFEKDQSKLYWQLNQLTTAQDFLFTIYFTLLIIHLLCGTDIMSLATSEFIICILKTRYSKVWLISWAS